MKNKEKCTYYKVTRGSGYGGRPYKIGEILHSPSYIIEKYGTEFLYVTNAYKRYIPEDGLSFGVGEESGYIYYADCRKATAEEAKPIIEEEQRRIKIKEAKNELKMIKDYIRERGERPEGINIIEGETMFDTGNIYGGGDWFVIANMDIWYVLNNGMDGDNWNLNNVKTGGAGAIGWKIVKSQEMVDRLLAINSILK